MGLDKHKAGMSFILHALVGTSALTNTKHSASAAKNGKLEEWEAPKGTAEGIARSKLTMNVFDSRGTCS